MSESADIHRVAQLILQHGGSELSKDLAGRILNALEDLGWVRPEMACAMVAAAGGTIVITEDLQQNPPKGVVIWRDALSGSVVLWTGQALS
jgi:hypothetical protein